MRVKVIIVSVLLLIGGYSLFWFQMADRAKMMTLDWIENSESRLGGTKVFAGDVTVSGFPYRIIIEAESLNAVVPAGRVGAEPLSIIAPAVSVVYQPWKPTHAIVVTDYFDAVFGPLDRPNLTFTFDNVKSSIVLDPTSMQLNNLSSVAEKVSWYRGVEREADESSTMETAEFHLRRSADGAQDQMSYDLPVNRAVFFKAQNANIKEFASTILGEKADEFKVEALLHATEQPDYTFAGLSKWRDEGGTLTIRSFDYGSTLSAIQLSGDLTLDENLKPLGAFDANVTGMDIMLRRLAQDESIPQMARLLLQAQADNETMPDEVPLAISMQNGLLYLGPIMLMELPAIIE